jgi:xanthine dehydrogenase accessory factor
MLLIGAGQLTEYLATMALFSGFAVTVCDPREEYRGAFNVAGAHLVTEMPDDVVKAFRPDRRSCVVALTHDPKLDDMALLEALETDAFYVGAIGSRRNNEARRQRMLEHLGQTQASLARLRGPIGIYIGSKTPPEIAVSVMAEILAVKNGVALPRDQPDFAWGGTSPPFCRSRNSAARIRKMVVIGAVSAMNSTIKIACRNRLYPCTEK